MGDGRQKFGRRKLDCLPFLFLVYFHPVVRVFDCASVSVEQFLLESCMLLGRGGFRGGQGENSSQGFPLCTILRYPFW